MAKMIDPLASAIEKVGERIFGKKKAIDQGLIAGGHVAILDENGDLIYYNEIESSDIKPIIPPFDIEVAE